MTNIETSENAADPANRLAVLEDEITTAIAYPQDGDVIELWKEYVDLHVALQGKPGPDDDIDAYVEYIIDHGEHGQDLRNAIPGLGELTRRLIMSRMEGAGQPEQARPTLNQAIDADPVILHSGQYVHTTTDIRIDGAGIDFIFDRTYRSQGTFLGPLGNNWDHRYNLFLMAGDQYVIRNAGSYKEEIYTRHARFGQTGFSYWVPPPGVHAIVREGPADTYIWRAANGSEQHYEPDPERPGRYRIRRIQNRFGNYLAFTYSGSMLSRIAINHPDRVIRLFYDRERLAAIRDYTTAFDPGGREWRYHYDANDNLIAARLPGDERHPEGATVCYEYDPLARGVGLVHQLVRVIDPDGAVYVENEYGRDAGLLSFGRVVRQRQGGGRWLFEYAEPVEEFDPQTPAVDRPAHETLVVEPNGHVNRHLFNRKGNLLLKESIILHQGQPQTVRHRSFYNSDGALIAEIYPDGSVVQSYYGRDDFARRRNIDEHQAEGHTELGDRERLAFGNLLCTVRRARRSVPVAASVEPAAWRGGLEVVLTINDPRDIIVKYSYEPKFQLPLTESSPRHTRDPDPAVTTPPREDSAYSKTVTRHEYQGSDKRLARTVYPDAALPDGSMQADNRTEYLAYDSAGRLLRRREPEGDLMVFEYSPATDGVREGYLKARVLDPNGLNLRTEYEVNELGEVVAVTSPYAPGAGAIPRSERELDVQGRPVKQVAPEPFRFETRTRHDRSGNAVRVERDLFDQAGQPLHGGVVIHTYCYDSQRRLLAESMGGNGTELEQHIVTRHHYDAAGNRVRTIRPNGSEIWYGYDERGNQVSVTRAACTPYASTTRARFNLRGEEEASIDARGQVTTRRYDVFGRLIAIENPQGDITLRAYDKSGNMVVERSFERVGERYRLLARSEMIYDILDRLTVRRQNLFHGFAPVTDPDDAFLDSPGPGVVFATQYWYDRQGRLLKEVNAKGQVTRSRYDAANRLVESIDNLGNRTVRSYDARGNVLRVDVHEVTVDSQGGSATSAVFSTLNRYDVLNRLLEQIDPAGNITRYEHDSRGRVLSIRNPLGNRQRFEYDVFGRRTAEISDMTHNGLGGGTPQPPLVTRHEYDALDRLTATTDPGGRRLEREYDELDRISLSRHPDGSVESFRYDAEDNLIYQQDSRGVAQRFKYDDLSQVVEVEVEYPQNQSARGATRERRVYDGLGRMVVHGNDYVTVRFTVDSLGRNTHEHIHVHVSDGSLSIDRQFEITRRYDRIGNLIELTLPSQRRIGYAHDALNRVAGIDNLSKGQVYPGSAQLPDHYPVLRVRYRGLLRSSAQHGNDTTGEYEYDAARRLIQIRYRDSNDAELLVLQQFHDGAGRMRRRAEFWTDTKAGNKYWFNSVGWLTRVEEFGSPVREDATRFRPGNAVLSPDQMKGQTDIDALLGDLADDPAGWTIRYDVNGNRTEDRLSGSTPRVYQSNTLNQYTQVHGNALSYDEAGNLAAREGLALSYDHRGQLCTVHDSTDGSRIARYFHDAQGRRVVELTAAGENVIVFNGPEVAEEYLDGGLRSQFIHEGPADSLVQVVTGSGEYWVHRDLVSSVRLLTDRSGRQAGRYRYHEFGLPLEQPAIANPFMFMGRKFDIATQSYDFRQRQYDPELGRFWQRDPANSANPYVFVNNNPLTSIDPTGLDRDEVLGNFDFANNLTLDINVGEYEEFLAREAYKAQVEGIVAEYADKTEEIGAFTSLLMYHPGYYHTRWWADRLRSYEPGQAGRFNAQMNMGFSFIGESLGVAGEGVLAGLGAVNHFVDPKGHLTRDFMIWSASSPIPVDDLAAAGLRGVQYVAMGSRARFVTLGPPGAGRAALTSGWWKDPEGIAGSTSLAKEVPYTGRWALLNKLRLKRYQATITNFQQRGTLGWWDTQVHESLHKFLAENIPTLYRLQRLEVRGKPVGALFEYAEEVTAYSLGHTAALRFHRLPFVHQSALKSVLVNQGMGNIALGYQRAQFVSKVTQPAYLGLGAGGAAYGGYRLLYDSPD